MLDASVLRSYRRRASSPTRLAIRRFGVTLLAVWCAALWLVLLLASDFYPVVSAVGLLGVVYVMDRSR